jgi:hypothetical protein
MIFLPCGQLAPRRLATKAGVIRLGLVNSNCGVHSTPMDPPEGRALIRPTPWDFALDDLRSSCINLAA